MMPILWAWASNLTSYDYLNENRAEDATIMRKEAPEDIESAGQIAGRRDKGRLREILMGGLRWGNIVDRIDQDHHGPRSEESHGRQCYLTKHTGSS